MPVLIYWWTVKIPLSFLPLPMPASPLVLNCNLWHMHCLESPICLTDISVTSKKKKKESLLLLLFSLKHTSLIIAFMFFMGRVIQSTHSYIHSFDKYLLSTFWMPPFYSSVRIQRWQKSPCSLGERRCVNKKRAMRKVCTEILTKFCKATGRITFPNDSPRQMQESYL